MKNRPLSELKQRVGVFSELPGTIVDLGRDPKNLLDRVGLQEEQLRDVDGFLPYTSLVELLELCAQETGRDDFGLHFGWRGQLKHLGFVAEVMRTAPTFFDAMTDFTKNHHRLARGGAVYLRRNEVACTIGYRPLVGGGRSRQFSMASIAFGYKFLLELSGVPPRRVMFGCMMPSKNEWRKKFDAEVEFNGTEFALEYPLSLLDLPSRAQNGNNREFAVRALAVSRRYLDPNLIDATKRMILKLMFSRALSADAVAASMKMSRRRLNRNLAKAELSVQRLIDEVRLEMAYQLMAETSQPLATVAQSLGFDEPASFSRFFRKLEAMPPSAWRREAMATG